MRRIIVTRDDIVDPQSGELVVARNHELTGEQVRQVFHGTIGTCAGTAHLEDFWSCCDQSLVGRDRCPQCGRLVPR